MRTIRLALLSLIPLGLFACGTTTRFQSTWSSPDAQPLHLQGRKVAAVFVTNDPMLRRRAEDAMTREIARRGAEGVASYSFLTDREARDTALARSRADEIGCAAAVVMRVVSSRTLYSRHPGGVVWVGPHYHNFWGGYWGWGWSEAWATGSLTVDRVVKVETLIYSLEHDQLVWGGVSKTVDPGEVENLVRELAIAVSQKMAQQGLIATN